MYTNVDELPAQAIQKIELSIERAKRRVEEGKDVILFVSNLNRLQDLYKKQFAQSSNTAEQSEISSLTMVKKLLSSARRTSDMGTLTIISIVEENGNIDFIASLKEICNMQLVLSNEKRYLDCNKIWPDILKSETRKINLLLTKEELDFAIEFKKNLNEENLEEKTQELEEYLLSKAN